MSKETEQIRVGLGVMVMKDGKVLMGKRKKEGLGKGEYAWPGGHLEHMESFEECAKREVMEETGMEVENVRFVRLYNLKEYAPLHFVDIGLIADWKNGEPQVLEPDKVEDWDWYDPKKLPEPLFATIQSYFDSLDTGRVYWDF